MEVKVHKGFTVASSVIAGFIFLFLHMSTAYGEELNLTKSIYPQRVWYSSTLHNDTLLSYMAHIDHAQTDIDYTYDSDKAENFHEPSASENTTQKRSSLASLLSSAIRSLFKLDGPKTLEDESTAVSVNPAAIPDAFTSSPYTVWNNSYSTNYSTPYLNTNLTLDEYSITNQEDIESSSEETSDESNPSESMPDDSSKEKEDDPKTILKQELELLIKQHKINGVGSVNDIDGTVDLITEYIPYMEECSLKYNIPVELISSILFREMMCINYVDDVVGEKIKDFGLSIKEKLLKKDSPDEPSIGFAQIGAKRAQRALERVEGRKIKIDKIKKMLFTEKGSIYLLTVVLNDLAEQRMSSIPSVFLTESVIKEILIDFNGAKRLELFGFIVSAGAEEYSNQTFEYFNAFQRYFTGASTEESEKGYSWLFLKTVSNTVYNEVYTP